MIDPLVSSPLHGIGGDCENAELAGSIAATVYEAGFFSYLPNLYLPLFLNDAVARGA